MKTEKKEKSYPLEAIYFCYRRSGEGGMLIDASEFAGKKVNWQSTWIQCPTCRGSGFVDWIQNVIRR